MDVRADASKQALAGRVERTYPTVALVLQGGGALGAGLGVDVAIEAVGVPQTFATALVLEPRWTETLVTEGNDGLRLHGVPAGRQRAAGRQPARRAADPCAGYGRVD